MAMAARISATSAQVLHRRLPTFPVMCGLSVFVSSRPAAGPPDPRTSAAFAAALETMHHRGPDDTRVEFGDGVAFGFKRLAIIDREHAAQPLRYHDRWTVVFNGEIYNYRQLRLELI